VVVTDDFGCHNMVVTDDFCCRNMVVPDNFCCRNMVIPDDFWCSNMVVSDDFWCSNMVVTYDILTTQWSCFSRKSSLSFSESSQRRKIQSRKSLKSSLRRILVAKISYFFELPVLLDWMQDRQIAKNIFILAKKTSLLSSLQSRRVVSYRQMGRPSRQLLL
jgi:hypothetical protein